MLAGFVMRLLFKRTDGTFVAEVNGLPYHVTPDEPDAYVMALAVAAQMGDGLSFEVQPPEPTEAELLAAERGRMVLTRLQFALQSLADGVMTAAETEAFVGPRVVPQIGEDAILMISDLALRQVARVRLIGFERLERTDPFLVPFQAAVQWTDERVDEFFRAGMLL